MPVTPPLNLLDLLDFPGGPRSAGRSCPPSLSPPRRPPSSAPLVGVVPAERGSSGVAPAALAVVCGALADAAVAFGRGCSPTIPNASASPNLEAGERAIASAAYGPALSHLRTGLALVGDDAWGRAYALTLDLSTAAAWAAHLSGDLEGMEALVSDVLRCARSVLDKVRAYTVRFQAYVVRGAPTAPPAGRGRRVPPPVTKTA